MIEPIKRILKKYKATRTQLATKKTISTMEIMAENDEKARAQVEEQMSWEHGRYSEGDSSGNTIQIDEEITIEEVK